MNQVPHITIEQVKILYPSAEVIMLKLLNEAIDKHNASIDAYNKKQANEQYITAEEARKLGAWNAEWSVEGSMWHKCAISCSYLDKSLIDGEVIKYRAIKPEPLDLSNIKGVGRNFEIKPEPVEPTCQIKNLDSGATQTMTREKAKLLQAELGDTVEWSHDQYKLQAPVGHLLFNSDGIYTYKHKANLVKLDGELMTRKAAIAKYEEVKDKCELESRSNFEHCQIFKKEDAPHWFAFDFNGAEYRLVAKPLKQVSWKDVPLRVMTNKGELREVYEAIYGDERLQAVVEVSMPVAGKKTCQCEFYCKDLTLAPASEQKWIPVIAPPEGLTVEYSRFHECLRITGLAEGYELK